jgi:hypothetical protein
MVRGGGVDDVILECLRRVRRVRIRGYTGLQG